MSELEDNEVVKSIESKKSYIASVSELNDLLSIALRAICLTRDHVGEEVLPAVDGWEWYEAGKRLANHLDGDEWSGEFRKRVNRYKSIEVRKVFKEGDWVFGIDNHQGCSIVFEGTYCDYQPFSYLDDYNPINFRKATLKEIELSTGAVFLDT